MSSISFSRPTVSKLLIATAITLGLLGLFVSLAGNASAGGDAKVTVNSTANIDDGTCEGPPNDAALGNCTLHEAIDLVNEGDADIINFHPPVFSKEQPGIINLCNEQNRLPVIMRDVVIDSKDSGVVIDGGSKDDDCLDGPFGPSTLGLKAEAKSDGLDFELNGGKNFEVVNISCGNTGIHVSGGGAYSLGTVTITGVIVDNSCSEGVLIDATNLESGSITNSEISSNGSAGVRVRIDACDADPDCALDDSVLDISGNRIFGGVDFTGGAVAGDGEAAGFDPQSGRRSRLHRHPQ